MPLKYRFALGMFAGAFFGTFVEARRLYNNNNELIDKYNELVEEHDKTVKQWAAQCEAVLYMITILEDRAIELTDFDLIALQTIVFPRRN